MMYIYIRIIYNVYLYYTDIDFINLSTMATHCGLDSPCSIWPGFQFRSAHLRDIHT